VIDEPGLFALAYFYQAVIVLAEVFVEVTAEGSGEGKGKLAPGGGEETILPACFGGGGEAGSVRMVVVGKWFLYGTPAAFEFHEAVVVAGGASEVEAGVAVGAGPGDGMPEEEVVGGEVEVVFVGCAVGIMEGGAGCEEDDASNGFALIFGEEEL